jgi:hypothetical protein
MHCKRLLATDANVDSTVTSLSDAWTIGNDHQVVLRLVLQHDLRMLLSLSDKRSLRHPIRRLRRLWLFSGNVTKLAASTNVRSPTFRLEAKSAHHWWHQVKAARY